MPTNAPQEKAASVDHLLGAQDRSYRFRSNLHGK